VYGDQIRRWVQARQRILNRLLTGFAALHHMHGLLRMLLMKSGPRAQSISSARRATTISATEGQRRNLRMVWIRMGAPSSSMNCLRLVRISRPCECQARGRKDDVTFHEMNTIVRTRPPPPPAVGTEAGAGLASRAALSFPPPR